MKDDSANKSTEGVATTGESPLAAAPGSASEIKITVAGVTFGAKDVKSAVVTLDGRDIHIGEKTPEERKVGFR